MREWPLGRLLYVINYSLYVVLYGVIGDLRHPLVTHPAVSHGVISHGGRTSGYAVALILITLITE